jgi:hypothetical protein
VPPAVALLNYISCGIPWRIFCQTGIFRGVFSKHHYFVVRISEAAMCGEHYIYIWVRVAHLLEMERLEGERLKRDGVETYHCLYLT